MCQFESSGTIHQPFYLQIGWLNLIMSIGVKNVEMEPVVNFRICTIDAHVNIYLEIAIEL